MTKELNTAQTHSTNELRWFEQFAAHHGITFTANDFDASGGGGGPFNVPGQGARTVAHRGGGGAARGANPFGPTPGSNAQNARSSGGGGLKFDLSAFARGDTQDLRSGRTSASPGVIAEESEDGSFTPFGTSHTHSHDDIQGSQNPQTSSRVRHGSGRFFAV